MLIHSTSFPVFETRGLESPNATPTRCAPGCFASLEPPYFPTRSTAETNLLCVASLDNRSKRNVPLSSSGMSSHASSICVSRILYTTPLASGSPSAVDLFGLKQTTSCGLSLCGGNGKASEPFGRLASSKVTIVCPSKPPRRSVAVNPSSARPRLAAASGDNPRSISCACASSASRSSSSKSIVFFVQRAKPSPSLASSPKSRNSSSVAETPSRRRSASTTSSSRTQSISR